MKCDKCHKRRGTIITAGGYILCKQCDVKLTKALAFKRDAKTALQHLFDKRDHRG